MTEMNWYRIWACLNIGSPRSFRYISLSWVTQWITQSQVSNGLCPKSAGFALQFWPRNPKDHREIMGNVIFIHFLRNAKLGGGWNLLVPESSGPHGLSLIQTGSSCHQPRRQRAHHDIQWAWVKIWGHRDRLNHSVFVNFRDAQIVTPHLDTNRAPKIELRIQSWRLEGN